MKTFLRRPGNKSKHLKHILPLIPKNYNTYIEPFVGTGALFLELEPKKWIINDMNKDIISIWNLVKTDPEYLLDEIQKFSKMFLPLNNEEKLKLCKEIVSRMDTYKSKKRTVMYLLMIYCSFRGVLEYRNTFHIESLYGDIFRKNQCHVFTEKYKDKINRVHSLIQQGQILNKDYKHALSKARKGDFVFLDPPYIEEKTYNFQYNKREVLDNSFSKELKIELLKLDKKEIKWMMTQIDTPNIRKLFNSYNVHEYINSQSFGNCNGSGKKELIITNY